MNQRPLKPEEFLYLLEFCQNWGRKEFLSVAKALTRLFNPRPQRKRSRKRTHLFQKLRLFFGRHESTPVTQTNHDRARNNHKVPRARCYRSFRCIEQISSVRCILRYTAKLKVGEANAKKNLEDGKTALETTSQRKQIRNRVIVLKRAARQGVPAKKPKRRGRNLKISNYRKYPLSKSHISKKKEPFPETVNMMSVCDFEQSCEMLIDGADIDLMLRLPSSELDFVESTVHAFLVKRKFA
ncbi:hypothetical protein METBIDRAFT_13512 [Metschnikowia bicuspidata var. bicuspidata NRRL YB-4993]|uniref:Uncharacterized protein n=1 Tax=Metschnikowia bicuspidata var. bicuspidata NRRL YB-4993 TaxID=869754 RepID=A0A1A0H554_9ASCO|nr:hypothetical protein METBIDRAFT_13512 [Metschnikowia bicuspidata var. bicuspidata NRRL YB-4993]OBA19209.1 hypothetical protein METBIDRAFT_13512 [Metschnikowia bicuspidata var. bicuspidata NRRL YB-4993]